MLACSPIWVPNEVWLGFFRVPGAHAGPLQVSIYCFRGWQGVANLLRAHWPTGPVSHTEVD